MEKMATVMDEFLCCQAMVEGFEGHRGKDGSKRVLTLVDAFKMGTHVEFLRRAGSHEYPLDEINGEEFIIPALEKIIGRLEETDFDSILLAEIEGKKKDLLEEYEEELNQEGGVVYINEPDGSSLSDSVNLWIDLLEQELKNQKRVSIPSSGLFDAEQAMEHPESLFEKEVIWTSLPQQTQDDLKEACRALAFACTTSAVIMALRAVEEQLRAWYKEETGRQIEKRTFGQVLSELDDTFNSNNRPAILSHLDYLKEMRNEVNHPEHSPTRQEAESTLYMVRATITKIQNRIAE